MFPQSESATELNAAISRVLIRMEDFATETQDYIRLVDQLAKLYKMKEIEENLRIKLIDTNTKQLEMETNCRMKNVEIALKRKDLDAPNRVSVDTWAIIAGNLAGIVLILGYEKANVITSRAIGFVTKLR